MAEQTFDQAFEQAVDASAQAKWEAVRRMAGFGSSETWDEIHVEERIAWRETARPYIKPATPILVAAALRQYADAIRSGWEPPATGSVPGIVRDAVLQIADDMAESADLMLAASKAGEQR